MSAKNNNGDGGCISLLAFLAIIIMVILSVKALETRLKRIEQRLDQITRAILSSRSTLTNEVLYGWDDTSNTLKRFDVNAQLIGTNAADTKRLNPGKK